MSQNSVTWLSGVQSVRDSISLKKKEKRFKKHLLMCRKHLICRPTQALVAYLSNILPPLEKKKQSASFSDAIFGISTHELFSFSNALFAAATTYMKQIEKKSEEDSVPFVETPFYKSFEKLAEKGYPGAEAGCAVFQIKAAQESKEAFSDYDTMTVFSPAFMYLDRVYRNPNTDIELQSWALKQRHALIQTLFKKEKMDSYLRNETIFKDEIPESKFEFMQESLVRPSAFFDEKFAIQPTKEEMSLWMMSYRQFAKNAWR